MRLPVLSAMEDAQDMDIFFHHPVDHDVDSSFTASSEGEFPRFGPGEGPSHLSDLLVRQLGEGSPFADDLEQHAAEEVLPIFGAAQKLF